MSTLSKYIVRFGTRDGETGTVDGRDEQIVKAYDMEDALERFNDSDPDGGWVATEIGLYPEDRAHRHLIKWVKVP